MRLTHNYNKTEKFSHKTLFYVQNKNDTNNNQKTHERNKKTNFLEYPYTLEHIKHINMKNTYKQTVNDKQNSKKTINYFVHKSRITIDEWPERDREKDRMRLRCL